MDQQRQSVSIVVPTLNRRSYLTDAQTMTAEQPHNERRSFRSHLVIATLIMIGVAVRVAWVSIPDYSSLAGDSVAYDFAAAQLVRQGTLLQPSDAVMFDAPELLARGAPRAEPLHDWAPGYPLFLGAIYFAGGSGPSARKQSAVLLAIMAGILLPLLAFELWSGIESAPEAWGWVVVGTVALWPSSILIERLMYSENLAVLVFTVWTVMIARLLLGIRSATAIRLLCCGAVGGVLYLVRVEFAPIVALGAILCGLVWETKVPEGKARPHRFAIKAPALILAAFVPFVIGVSIWNGVQFGKIVPMTSQSGKTLFNAAIHSDTFGFSPGGPNRQALLQSYVPGKPFETDRNLQKLALGMIRSDPSAYVVGVMARWNAVNLKEYGEPAVNGKPWPYWVWRGVLRLCKLALIIGCAIALPTLWSRSRATTIFLVGGYVYKCFGVHGLLNGQVRMFHPFYAVGLAVAAIGWRAAWSYLRSRRSKHLASAADMIATVNQDAEALNMNPLRPGVTVVVPTLNRGLYLLDTLRDLLAQEYRPIEILVVDQSSEEAPELLDLVLKHPELISYHKVQFLGLPLARNYGWQQAKYEAIIFVDDDIRCGSDLASEHLRGLNLPNTGMVAGGIDERIVSKVNHAAPGYFNSWTATPLHSFGSAGECLVQHVAGCNFSVWRRVLRAAGGFDEALALGAALYEETELCLRVQQCGFDIYFNGKARLQHLAAGNGGCRVPDLPKYMASLAHNRAVLIGRYLRWFQTPTAYLRLVLLFMSYAMRYHTLGIFRPGLDGFLAGMKAARQRPLCSRYSTQVQA